MLFAVCCHVLKVTVCWDVIPWWAWHICASSSEDLSAVLGSVQPRGQQYHCSPPWEQQISWRFTSSAILHRVMFWPALPWKWGPCDTLISQELCIYSLLTQWHTVTFQKTWIVRNTDVRISEIMLSCICFRTLATFTSKSTVMSLDWVTKNERYFISGNRQGVVRLYDTRDNRIMWELGADAASPLKDARSEDSSSRWNCYRNICCVSMCTIFSRP